jgi:hypothetical protein
MNHLFGPLFWGFQHVGNINAKPVPRWPDRRSYRANQRDAAKRRNIAKGGTR